MPSKSKSQQRFFGVVKSMQKGDIPKKGEAGKAAKTMTKKDVDDFASTKHKGKPEKVKQETKVRSLIRKMVREIIAEIEEGGPGSGPHSDDEENPFDREPSDAEMADIEKEFEGVKEGIGSLQLKTFKVFIKGFKKPFRVAALDTKDAKRVAHEMMRNNTVKITKIVKEDFAGSYPKGMRKKFDSNRRKQSEVLGYKLTGTDDVKTEIDDATIKEGKLNEVDFSKIKLPSQVNRFLNKFVDSMKDANLNRIRRSAILYRVINASGMSIQQLMADIQKIKKELK